ADAQQRGQAVFHAHPLVFEGEQVRSADALRGPVIEEAGAEQVATSAVGDHPVAGLGADMDMSVDEARNDEIAACVDGLVHVHLAIMPLAEVGDPAALQHDHAIAQDAVLAAIEGDDPATLYEGTPRFGVVAHGLYSPRCRRDPWAALET